jgi:DNA-binding transcriptional LysR family regulator
MKRLPPLNALRAFHAAAQEGSFTKAGVALHVTQGAVSRQIKLLEDVMGRPLFFRVHQGIALTESGKMLAQGLQRAFSELEIVIERINNDQRRLMIAINLPPTFATRWLAPRLSKFSSLYPFVDFQITTNAIQSIRDTESFDCVVFFDTAAWPKADCDLLMLEKHVMVSHPSLWHGDVPPTLGQQTLLHILNGKERMPVWESWLEKHQLTHVDPKPGVAFSTLDQVINAALSGAGVAIVDENMIRPVLSQGSLLRFNELSVDGPYGYWSVDVAKDDEHKAVVRLFREWLKQEVAGDLPMAQT